MKSLTDARSKIRKVRALAAKAHGAMIEVEELTADLEDTVFDQIASDAEQELMVACDEARADVEKKHERERAGLMRELEKLRAEIEKTAKVVRELRAQRGAPAQKPLRMHPDDHVELTPASEKALAEHEAGLKKQHYPATLRILIALYQSKSGALTRAQVAFITGMSASSGATCTAYADLQEDGYIEGRGTLAITASGRKHVEDFADELLPQPEGHVLFENFCKREGGVVETMARALRALYREVGDEGDSRSFTRAQIAAKASELESRHVSHTSGAACTAFARLVKLDLVQGRGALTFTPWLVGLIEPIQISVFSKDTGKTTKVAVSR